MSLVYIVHNFEIWNLAENTSPDKCEEVIERVDIFLANTSYNIKQYWTDPNAEQKVFYSSGVINTAKILWDVMRLEMDALVFYLFIPFSLM